MIACNSIRLGGYVAQPYCFGREFSDGPVNIQEWEFPRWSARKSSLGAIF
jgi:hypothetical protein